MVEFYFKKIKQKNRTKALQSAADVHKKQKLQTCCLKGAKFWTFVEAIGQKARQTFYVYTLTNNIVWNIFSGLILLKTLPFSSHAFNTEKESEKAQLLFELWSMSQCHLLVCVPALAAVLRPCQVASPIPNPVCLVPCSGIWPSMLQCGVHIFTHVCLPMPFSALCIRSGMCACTPVCVPTLWCVLVPRVMFQTQGQGRDLMCVASLPKVPGASTGGKLWCLCLPSGICAQRLCSGVAQGASPFPSWCYRCRALECNKWCCILTCMQALRCVPQCHNPVCVPGLPIGLPRSQTGVTGAAFWRVTLDAAT